MATLGLCCFFCRAFSSCCRRGLLYYDVQASRFGGFFSCEARALGTRASAVAARKLSDCGHRLSDSMACEIYPNQGLNLCPLLWRANSYTLCLQGRP